ncbi:hypothetical protein HY522_03165 [bacterium]|nr:hypothetical protein [bacterium]
MDYGFGMDRAGEISVHGNGLGVLVVAGIIVASAVGMPLGLFLTGTPIGSVCGTLDPDNVIRIWGICSLMALGLCFYSGYRYSRRLILKGNILRYRSWFSDRNWQTESITDVTYRREFDPNTSDTQYLVLWRRDEELIRIDLAGWPKNRFFELIQNLTLRQPLLNLAAEVRQFLQP